MKREPPTLRMRPDLPPNDHHPLAKLDPKRRGEERERLIGSILARLAVGSPSKVAIIDPKEKPDAAKET